MKLLQGAKAGGMRPIDLSGYDERIKLNIAARERAAKIRQMQEQTRLKQEEAAKLLSPMNVAKESAKSAFGFVKEIGKNIVGQTAAVGQDVLNVLQPWKKPKISVNVFGNEYVTPGGRGDIAGQHIKKGEYKQAAGELLEGTIDVVSTFYIPARGIKVIKGGKIINGALTSGVEVGTYGLGYGAAEKLKEGEPYGEVVKEAVKTGAISALAGFTFGLGTGLIGKVFKKKQVFKENPREIVNIVGKKKPIEDFVASRPDLIIDKVKTLGKDLDGNKIQSRLEWDYKNDRGVLLMTPEANDINLAHEIGHYIEKRYPELIEKNLDEIKVVSGGKQNLNEDFAFSVARVLYDPEARTKAPKLTKDVEDVVKIELPSAQKKPALDSEEVLKTNSDPLIQEAKKYKSAEEFVKAQGQTVYRGGKKLDVSKINEEGLPVTLNNKVAEQFARSKNQFAESPAGQIMGYQKGQNVVESYQLSPSAKIATRSDISDDVFNAYKQANPLTKPDVAEPIITKWAKENGYDAIDFRTLGKTSAKEAEIKVLNPDILKTKSQLEEIWNKAQKEPPEAKLIQEAKKYKSAEEFVSKRLGLSKSIEHAYDNLLGNSYILKDHRAQLQISLNENPKEIYLTNIASKDLNDLKKPKVGAGLGTDVVQELKKYADATGKKLIIADATESGSKYWDTIKWLERDYGIKMKDNGNTISIPSAYSYSPKSQLEEIWNKAQKETPEAKLIQEAKKYKSAEEFVKAQGTRTGVEVRDKIGTKLQDPYTAEYLPTNPDGTITLYHSTTKEGAEKIRQSGIFGSKTEGGDIYFTNNKKGYGGIGKDKDVVLAFNVDPKKVKFDDVYRGELHLKGNNTDIGGIKPVEIRTKSQLTDIWNKANKTDDIIQAESNKIKLETTRTIKQKELSSKKLQGNTPKKKLKTDGVNWGSINTSTDTENILKQIYKDNDQFKAVRPSRTNKDIIEGARAVGVDVNNQAELDKILKQMPNANTAVKLKQSMVDSANDLMNYLKTVDTGTLTAEQTQKIRDKFIRTQAIAKAFSGLRTESSHLLRSMGIEVREGENMAEMAVKLKEILGESTDTSAFIRKSQEIISPTKLDTAQAIWYNSILSGWKTWTRNVMDTTASLVTETFSKAANPATLLETPFFIAGLIKGFPRSLYKAFKVLVGSEEFTNKMEYAKIAPYFKNKQLNFWATEVSGRILSAQDVIFHSTTKSAMDMISDFSKQMKKTGVDDRTAIELNDAMNRQLADRVVYRNKPMGVVGKISGAISALTSKVKGLKFIIPFTRVVANVTDRKLDYLPVVNLLRTFGKKYLSEEAEIILKNTNIPPSKYDALRPIIIKRLKNQQLGRLYLGTLFSAAAFGLAMNDRISGGGPTNANERKQLQETGWRPYSVKIGNKWIPYSYFGPLSGILAGAGSIHDSIKYDRKGENPTKIVFNGLFGFAQNLMTNSFLSGVSDLFEVLSGRGLKPVDYARNILVGFLPIPAIWTQTIQALDGKSYDIQTFKEAIQWKFGVSKNLTPRLNALGEEIRADLIYGLTPAKERREIQTKLTERGLKVNVPSKNTKLKDEVMTREQLFRYTKIRGDYIKENLDKVLDIIDKAPNKEQKEKLWQRYVDKMSEKAKLSL